MTGGLPGPEAVEVDGDRQSHVIGNLGDTGVCGPGVDGGQHVCGDPSVGRHPMAFGHRVEVVQGDPLETSVDGQQVGW